MQICEDRKYIQNLKTFSFLCLPFVNDRRCVILSIVYKIQIHVACILLLLLLWFFCTSYMTRNYSNCLCHAPFAPFVAFTCINQFAKPFWRVVKKSSASAILKSPSCWIDHVQSALRDSKSPFLHSLSLSLTLSHESGLQLINQNQMKHNAKCLHCEGGARGDITKLCI